MSTIHFLYVSHLSHVLHIFALLLHPLSTWTIGILARLFLYPSPRKTATLTTSDNDVIRPLSQIDSSSSAMLHASNPILLPIIKADAREDQEFEPRNDPDHSYSAMLHASNPTLMPISEADKDQKCEPSNDPDYSSSATLHASNPTFFPITEADTEAEEDQQSEPGNDPVDDNVTSPQLSQRQPASNQAFFTGAQGFAIYGGQFTNIAHASENRDSDTGKVSIYPRHKLHNWKVVRSRKNWTFNSAVTAKKEGSDESISVFVQTFEGPGAKQLFSKTLEFSRGLVNGHHLNIIGISPSAKSNTRTDSHYIVYERAHSKDTRRLLAAALVKGEKETTTVGLKTVHGIVSALAHLSKVASSLRLAQIDIENFDTFSDELGHIVLCYTPNMVDTDRFERARGFADHDSEIILCSSLIKKIFTEANHTVWREKLDRYLGLADADFDFDFNDLGSDDEGRHNQSRSSALELSAQAPQNDWESSSRQPRRELIWKSLASDMPLSDISEAYGDFLDSAFDTSLSVHLPHRFGMSSTTSSVHKCKGYRREEVTLTPDAFRNTVVVYQEPSLNERCVLCGKVVTMEGRKEENKLLGAVQDLSTVQGVNAGAAEAPKEEIPRGPLHFDPPVENSRLIGQFLAVRYQGKNVAFDLDRCLSAVNGKFQWGSRGGFVSAARNLSLVNGSELRAELLYNGRWLPAQINLATNIGVENGQLQYIRRN